MATIEELEARSSVVREELASGESEYKALEEYNPAKQEGDTRTNIAYWFVIGYFSLFLLILAGVPLYNGIISDEPPTIDLQDTLQIFGSLIGTSLGFVVGYYFKSRN